MSNGLVNKLVTAGGTSAALGVSRAGLTAARTDQRAARARCSARTASASSARPARARASADRSQPSSRSGKAARSAAQRLAASTQSCRAWAISACSTSGQGSVGNRSIAAAATGSASAQLRCVRSSRSASAIAHPQERKSLADGGPKLRGLGDPAGFLGNPRLQDRDLRGDRIASPAFDEQRVCFGRSAQLVQRLCGADIAGRMPIPHAEPAPVRLFPVAARVGDPAVLHQSGELVRGPAEYAANEGIGLVQPAERTQAPGTPHEALGAQGEFLAHRRPAARRFLEIVPVFRRKRIAFQIVRLVRETLCARKGEGFRLSEIAKADQHIDRIGRAEDIGGDPRAREIEVVTRGDGILGLQRGLGAVQRVGIVKRGCSPPRPPGPGAVRAAPAAVRARLRLAPLRNGEIMIPPLIGCGDADRAHTYQPTQSDRARGPARDCERPVNALPPHGSTDESR